MDITETIALFGATGKAGGAILERLLADGFQVRALARAPQKLSPRPGLTVIAGDVLDPQAVSSTLDGARAVVSAIGPTRSGPQICDAATRTILGEMKRAGLRRYAVISGAAVQMPGDQRNLLGRFMATVLSVMEREMMADKASEATALRDSGLDWTLLRCPMIADGDAPAPCRTDLKTPKKMSVQTGGLAHLVAHALREGAFIQQAPFVYS